MGWGNKNFNFKGSNKTLTLWPFFVFKGRGWINNLWWRGEGRSVSSKPPSYDYAPLHVIRTFTDSGAADVLVGILVEHVPTLLTVASHGVVLTVQTHPSADPPVGLVHRRVKRTPVRVAVTVTL